MLRGEQANTGPVAEEAQVPIVGDNVDRSVPGELTLRGSAGARVVDGADVASVEPYAWTRAKHVQVSWVLWGEA